MLVSSAKQNVSAFEIFSNKLFNKIGPKTVPCGILYEHPLEKYNCSQYLQFAPFHYDNSLINQKFYL